MPPGRRLLDDDVAVDDRLAASPGTEVLPTCSMATRGTPAAAIAAVYSRRNSSYRRGQLGSYSDTWIMTDTLRREADNWPFGDALHRHVRLTYPRQIRMSVARRQP